MTTDSGNDQTPNNAESEIVRTIGELPEEVLAALQQLPPEFINRLADLSPEAIEQLTRLPAAMLGGLSALPTPMLEWLGRASGRSDSSLSAGTLIRFASIAHLSSEPLRTLKAIPSEMLKVMAALPPDVFNSLMELPAALLKQLPDALAATSDTLDEIPTNLAELSADSEDSRDSSSNIAPELMATLSEMPDGAIQTIASLSPESIATISELDADILETIRQLPEELLEAISQVPSGALSTIFELPIDSATTLSELDPKLLEQLAADDTPSDTGEPAPKFPSMLLVKLGQAEDGSGRVLGRLLAEAQSYKELRSAPSSQHSLSDFDNAAATVSEIPENAFPLDERATMPEVSSSFTDADFDEEGDTDHGEFAASASGSAADDDNSDDPGATDQDIPTDIAAMAADTRPEDSFEEASIADAWAEGLSALDTGDQKPRDRDIIESGDFSQVINPEGISEDDDSNGGTVESDDWEPANAGDGSATQGRDDEDGSGDDSYGETVQSDDLSLEFGGGMQTFQDDASKTVPTTDGHAESEDDSYGATVQSDEGWSTEGLSALDQNAGSNESYSENGQRDASSNPGRTIQDASPDDDESFSQTVQSDDNWSADGSNSLNASESDDDSFGATVQSDEWSNAGSDDQSFSQTVNLNDSFSPSGDNDDDSFGATVQSGEHTQDESFSQTIASSDLTADERRTMADAWGTNLDDANVRPDMTIKSDNVKKASPNHTLVITQKQLGTGKILDYEKGHPFPEPKEPEYELLKKLGEGGMGLVFMARQRSIDREVALKMLKPKTAKDPEQRAKFLTEAVVTGDLDHPNIVPIYDVGSSPDNALFYAMKKVEGTPWLDVVLEKSLEENLDILMSTSDAVSFAHSRGVVHRDLKPENVMLGAFNEVLVMDWGLAYSTEGFRKSKSITESTSMGGTPAYMAPEMATGPIKKIGPRSDVYLLGAILFEIVTGKPPHAGKNAMKCLMSAARNQIRDSDNERTRRNDPTGELLKIAHKAMATKLEERYQSVNEMQEAIRDYESHTESITLTLRALEELREAKAKQDYDLFSRARFGYEEALNLWGANTHAQNGLVDTKFAYAKCAQTKGDFDLGMSLLDTTVPEHKALNDELLDARNTVLAREQQLEEQKAARAKMRRIITVGTVAALIMMSGLAGWAFMEREEAVKQEQIAILNADEAKRQEEIAKVS
ncbi:MAG: serine/threonine-protein kinase, partial [Planctomycetota bacterium]|nr:serine/threonine-protein kinase [Planctomycetota bacterium]